MHSDLRLLRSFLWLTILAASASSHAVALGTAFGLSTVIYRLSPSASLTDVGTFVESYDPYIGPDMVVGFSRTTTAQHASGVFTIGSNATESLQSHKNVSAYVFSAEHYVLTFSNPTLSPAYVTFDFTTQTSLFVKVDDPIREKAEAVVVAGVYDRVAAGFDIQTRYITTSAVSPSSLRQDASTFSLTYMIRPFSSRSLELSSRVAVNLETVPEPASIAAVSLGLAALVRGRRRI